MSVNRVPWESNVDHTSQTQGKNSCMCGSERVGGLESNFLDPRIYLKQTSLSSVAVSIFKQALLHRFSHKKNSPGLDSPPSEI